jgi:hypothetical protein
MLHLALDAMAKIRLGYELERETDEVVPVPDIRAAWCYLRAGQYHRNIPEDVGMAAGLAVNVAAAYKRRWFGPPRNGLCPPNTDVTVCAIYKCHSAVAGVGRRPGAPSPEDADAGEVRAWAQSNGGYSSETT